MKINILTEDYFVKTVKGKPYIKQAVPKDFLEEVAGSFYFFEVPEKSIQFMYIRERNLVISFSEELPLSEGWELDYSTWKLEQIEDKIPKMYTLNSLKKVCCFADGLKDFPDGYWRLENKKSQEVFEFAIKTSIRYWLQTRIGFPEKLETKVDTKLVESKTYFIENIIHGLRKDNQRSDIQG